MERGVEGIEEGCWLKGGGRESRRGCGRSRIRSRRWRNCMSGRVGRKDLRGRIVDCREKVEGRDGEKSGTRRGLVGTRSLWERFPRG